MLAGCAAIPPSENESSAPTRLGVTQQPGVTHGEERPFYVLCAECAAPSPKTPFVAKSTPITTRAVATKEPVKHETKDKLRSATQRTKAETANSQAKILFTAHFAFGTARLSDYDKQSLLNILPELKQRSLVVAGYTDNIGPQDFNDWLALSRARSVKSYLIERGLDPKDIKASGHGKCCYLGSNDNPSNRATNRRAEIRHTSVVKDATSGSNPTANQPGEMKP